MSTKTPDEVQVIEPPRLGKRRFYTAQEKQGFLQEAEAPSGSMSAVRDGTASLPASSSAGGAFAMRAR